MIRSGTAVILSLLMATGCSVIMGKDDAGSLTGASFRHVETLRNEASLRGESLRDAPRSNDASTSLQQPNNVYADNFRVYATDFSPPRVFVFERGDRRVNILDGIVPPPEDEVKLLNPTGIVVDAAGTLWAADAQQGRVFGYTRNGKLLYIIGQMGELGRPSGLAVDHRRNRLYVTDASAHVVKVYSIEGIFIQDIGANAKPREGFKVPGAVSLDAAGNLFVLDTHYRRVQRYGPEGNYLGTIVVGDVTPGLTIRPKGIALDSSGRLYVTDAVSNNILVFDREGEFLFTWGRTGTLMGEFWAPAGIYIDARDFIHIADQMNGRISIYQYLK